MSDPYTPKGVNYAPSADFLDRKSGGMPQALRHGRIPPQAIDMEQAVIGSVISEKGLDKVEDILTPEMFYKEAHRLLFKAVLDLKAEKIGIDMLTVKTKLSQDGTLENAGGFHYILELCGNVVSSLNIEYHARVIEKQYRKRESIKIGDKMVSEGFDETTDADDVMEDASKSLSMLVTGSTKSLSHMPDKQIDGMKRYENNMKLRKSFIESGAPMITGIPCGLSEVDTLTRGWQNGHLIIKAARPGVGKTTGAVSDSIAAAASGAIVAFFSLEMTEEELQDKIVGMKAMISPKDIADGNITTDQLRRLQDVWSRSNGIYIDETPAVTLRHVRSNGRRIRKENPGKKMLIIIDYLQLMSPSGNVRGRNREQEVAEISKGLKELAKELKCPVIALSQMSRSIETRGGDKKPMLSDLRESGAIEQDADIVIFHYRASMHGVEQYDDGSSTKGTGEFLVKKNRGGPLKDVMLRWEPWCRGWINQDESFIPTTTENAVDDLNLPPMQPNMKYLDRTAPKHSDEQPGKEGGGDFFPF
jgi:replicative DNA helicase